MSGDSAFFLACGVVLSALVVWGLATGDMPTKYLYGDRAGHPKWFWATGAFNAALSLACIYLAWAEW